MHGWVEEISDSEGLKDKLKSKLTLGCKTGALRLELTLFFGLDIFSLPRWKEKSSSRSIDDPSSVSLAEDTVVHAVAELPLLSEELEQRPNPRHNGNSICCSKDPPDKLHFLLIPLEADKPAETEELGKSRRNVVSAQPDAVPAPPTWTVLLRFLNVVNAGLETKP